jgi:hypothetical protein
MSTLASREDRDHILINPGVDIINVLGKGRKIRLDATRRPHVDRFRVYTVRIVVPESEIVVRKLLLVVPHSSIVHHSTGVVKIVVISGVHHVPVHHHVVDVVVQHEPEQENTHNFVPKMWMGVADNDNFEVLGQFPTDTQPEDATEKRKSEVHYEIDEIGITFIAQDFFVLFFFSFFLFYVYSTQ